MKGFKQFSDAFLIFAKYMDDIYYCPLNAEHDVIYTDNDMYEQIQEDSEDGKALIALGWVRDTEYCGWAYYT